LQPWLYGISKIPILLFAALGVLTFRSKVKWFEVSWLSLGVYVLILGVILSEMLTILYGAIFLLALFMTIYFSYGISVSRLEYIINLVVKLQCIIIFFGIVELVCLQYEYIVFYRDYEVGYYKADSFYGNPNPLSIVSALLLTLRHNISKKMKLDFINVFLFVGVVIGGAKISYVILIFYLLFLQFPLKPTMSVVVIICLVVFPIVLSDVDFINDIYNKRVEIWLAGLEMWKDSKVIGVGFGNFQLYNTLLEGGGIGDQYGLHSMYLTFLVEGGFLGFSSLILLMLASLKKAFLHNRKVYAMLVCLYVSQLTEFLLGHEEIYLLVFSLIYACLNKKEKSFER
jgi:O-antigen ligase